MVEPYLTKIARQHKYPVYRIAISRKVATMMDLEIQNIVTGCQQNEVGLHYGEVKLVVMA